MSVRPAAVAGMFYPADAVELRTMMMRDLAAAPSLSGRPRALMVPHAGYIYSGPTASCVYALLQGQSWSRVVLAGPAHRVGFYGIALSSRSAFRTPLGDVSLVADGAALVDRFEAVHFNDEAHAQEHSLEVQLPFLQLLLDDFELLPLCVGMVEPELLTEVLASFATDRQTLLLISSDLSHYHPYAQANRLDHATLERITSGQLVSHEQACGATGVNAMTMLAGRNGLRPQLLDYRNSGDTAGEKDRVVGYGGIAWFEGGGHA